ncbi:MAG: class I SAM-dependent methyltransferase [bacterium]
MPLETINCPLCESAKQDNLYSSCDFRYSISSDRFSLAKCKACGFIFLNPRPAKEDIAKFYPGDFNRRPDSVLYKLIAPSFKAARQQTIRALKIIKGRGKVLDIGCGNGDFLLAMYEQGYDVSGAEPNAAAEEFCPAQIRGRIVYKNLEDCAFSNQSFDIVTSFQSLEHAHDLNGLLAEVSRILKDDGLLYLCLPSADFFEARFFKAYYYNLEVPRHLYFFNKKSLEAILSKHGFKTRVFLSETLFELVSTPASFFYYLKYYLQDKRIGTGKVFKGIFFIPLVLARALTRIIFIFDSQNLKVICRKI